MARICPDGVFGNDRTAFCHRYPCEMFGTSEDEATTGRARNRSIHRKFGRYHEEAGNDAG